MDLSCVLPLDLKLGDILVFPSSHITHFNTHFTGRRMTIVLHSDGIGGDSWLKDSHGWGGWIVNHRRNGLDDLDDLDDDTE